MRADRRRHPAARPSRQHGVVLLFSLIALLVLLIASVGLVRSFKTSMFMSTNIAFKRDLQNQGERAMDRVLGAFRPTGALASPAARSVSNPAQHYSAVALPSNELGIPDALQTEAQYAIVTDRSKDITSSNDPSLAGMAIRIQYVVDRLCASAGDETILGGASCVLANTPIPAGTSSSNLQSADRAPLCATCASAAPQGVVYRLSIKVSGPRGTNSFFQSTFTIPSST
jgi:Tfp pilus assembly protein PilX